MTVPDKRASCRSLRPLTRSTAPRNPPARNLDHHRATNPLPQLHPDQKPHDRLDLRTHRNPRITIVLSFFTQPPANPNLHALNTLSTALEPRSFVPLPCPSPLSQILIRHHQPPLYLSPPDLLLTPSPNPLETLSLTTPAPSHMPKNT